MEDATRISEQLQQGIELERQELSQVHEDSRGERRALWSNLLVGLVFYLLGVLTPVLISTDALREQLRHWFHFG